MIHSTTTSKRSIRRNAGRRSSWFSATSQPLAILDGIVSTKTRRDALPAAEGHPEPLSVSGRRTAGPYGYQPVEFLDIPSMASSADFVPVEPPKRS